MRGTGYGNYMVAQSQQVRDRQVSAYCVECNAPCSPARTLCEKCLQLQG